MIRPRLAGISISRSAFASDRPRYFSACTPCTNQDDPARKTKTATMPQRTALMRNWRNFWSSRYTRMGLPRGLTSRGLDRFLTQEQCQQLVDQHAEEQREDGFDEQRLLEHLDALFHQDVDEHINHQLVHDHRAAEAGTEGERAPERQARVDVSHYVRTDGE